jgi:arylsulfatase A-like enzyme
MLSRRSFLSASAVAAAARLAAASKARLNVLFIAVDDMRPDLGCYGNSYVRTPNLDKLAARGMTFTRAYCQQAVCSPSRTSLLTGRRPDTTRVYELRTHFRKNLPDVATLPEHFKNNGYVTTGLGKLFHGGLDDPRSWSIPSWTPGSPAAWNTPENASHAEAQWKRVRDNGLRMEAPRTTRQQRGPAWAMPDVADNELADGKTADTAIRALGELKGKQFFLGAGFLKPHLPFIAPKKYFDLYPKEKVRLVDYPLPPKGVPQIAMHNFGELRYYSDIPEEGAVPEEKALELVRAYYAALSYTDAQIGRVLDELDRLGLRENTVVIVWGDHGYHLGDHGLWNKHTNFERAVRVPMIVSVPGQKNAGKKSPALTEFVDIYPTLAEVCGLARPEGLEGISFAPLLDRPNRQWKTAAFSQYPRGKGAMGYSMRTERYRYTEWRIPGSDERPVELYDYQTDPDEKVNLAVEPENAALVKELAERLKAGWRGAIPAS